MASSLKFDDITALTPDVKRAILEEGQLVLQAIERAGNLRAGGQHEDAAKICREVLGRDSMQSKRSTDTEALAGLYELLGDCLGECGHLGEARDHLEKAIHIRDPVEYGGLGRGDRKMAAYSRERLAYLMEAQGQMREAQDLRSRGEAKGEMLCSNWSCPEARFHRRDELRACSACYAVFYHSVACQKTDWTERHKITCKAYQKEQKSKGKAAA